MGLCKLVIVLLVLATVASHFGVEAARALPDDFARANNLATYSSAAYENARYTMASWLERLPSGPSPKGPGH
ncbi:hypothetical protein ACJRO7_029496 [Eucalyptus globulus]|uniref:Uncharacterized protein n=1 Tax=Eucalyptus globulus TaxID=34317 RepID=A0ABD3JBZ7_EUCGL